MYAIKGSNMKLYFTLKSIPELSDLNRQERIRLWRRNSFRGLVHKKTLAAFAIYFLWSYLIFYLVHYIQDQSIIKLSDHTALLLQTFFGYVVGLYCVMLVWINNTRPYLRKKRGM